ncbi:hypothetical protein UFOVP610_46 [uncultured Caudovirales phage]|uniref:Uncharacterized protein n=1 Tax=uncultured Caudovirales phage TaxID=2100421 RepID=A0A6J5NCF1_9CAUD|nr:hypothetical protein UFOVP610_46 [uncultured Caudovirales phage]
MSTQVDQELRINLVQTFNNGGKMLIENWPTAFTIMCFCITVYSVIDLLVNSEKIEKKDEPARN